MAIASSMGKNRATAGISSVPSPNPEKSVRAEVSNAAMQTTNNSTEPLVNGEISILADYRMVQGPAAS